MIGRLISGAVVVGAVVAALVVPSSFTPPANVGPVPVPITVTPARQDVACPGPLVIPAGDLDSDDPVLDSGSDDRDFTVTTPGSEIPAGEGIATDAVVAGQVERVGDGDLAGLAALTCTAPLPDQWLVGGATTLGSSARLVLTNPSRAAVEATVRLYGRLGEIEGTRVIAIAPFSQEAVLLEGFAVEVPAVVARVTATGGGVVAALQDSRLDGFQARGTEWVVAGAAPAREVIIPGTGAPERSTTVIRLLAPEGATVRMGLADQDGAAVWEGVASLVLEPGVVVEVPVPPGTVSAVEISADSPVVAAALLTTERDAVEGAPGGAAADIAWIPGAIVADRPASAVAPGGDQTLVAFAPQGGVFTLTDADGTVLVEERLFGQRAASFTLDVPRGTIVSSESPVVWAIVARTDAGFVTAVTPTWTTIEPVDVEVLQRRYVP